MALFEPRDLCAGSVSALTPELPVLAGAGGDRLSLPACFRFRDMP